MATTRRRHVKQQEELLVRTIEVASVRTYVSLHIITARGAEPQIGNSQWLEVRGTADESIRGVRDVVITVIAKDRTEPGPARPARVGTIIQVRPHLTAVVAFPHAAFDRVWSMALAGHVKHASIVFTKPRYRSALVESLSFSNEPIE